MTVEITHENWLRYKKQTNHIDALLNRVWEETCFRSDLNYSNNKAFRELVGLGPRIVPYIVYHMTHKGADWIQMNLLGAITGEHPVSERHGGKFYEHIIDWLSWYLTSKYYTDDVYHGLI